MVQVMPKHGATLVEGMAKFVAEDLSYLDTEANWWHQRVRLVEHWLQDETSRVCIPDDGTEEMIRRHIHRGDLYPRAKYKCWKYIVTELRDLTCFAGIKVHDTFSHVNMSPSRGKLRPGKELIVLSDNMDGSISNASTPDCDNLHHASSWSLEPLTEDKSALKKPRRPTTAAYLTRRQIESEAEPVMISTGKGFAEMSLLERQMEWLKKKRDKMEAERLRQVEENERELTFQPKLIRRITYSGDKYFRENSSATGSSRSFPRSESSRRLGGIGPVVLLKERTLPKVPRLSLQRRLKRKTPLQSASLSQPVGVPCKLLESMKLDLEASLTSARLSSEAETERSSLMPHHDVTSIYESVVSSTQNCDTNADTSRVIETEVPTVAEETKENTPAWSTKPTIGGRRADFDSSETKVRLVLQDASKFELSSMYRKTDRRAGRDGVALHVGRREDTLEEQVIAVLFDREKVTEGEAATWWTNHQHRFAKFIEPMHLSEKNSINQELMPEVSCSLKK